MSVTNGLNGPGSTEITVIFRDGSVHTLVADPGVAIDIYVHSPLHSSCSSPMTSYHNQCFTHSITISINYFVAVSAVVQFASAYSF